MKRLFLFVLAFMAVFSAQAAPNCKTALPDTFKLLCIEDTGFQANPGVLLNASEKELELGSQKNAYKISVNAFFLELNGKKILFDAGVGKGGGGLLEEALRSEGIKPEDVDYVILTHTHGDHIGWLLKPDATAYFPKAILMLSKAEFAKWQGDSNPYVKAYGERVKTFDCGAEIVKGVKALESEGHTLGHSSFLLEKDGAKAIIAGDLVHIGLLQFANPKIAVKFDSNADMAIASRKKIFDMAAEKKIPLAFAHIKHPGIGFVEKDGEAYIFKPLGFAAEPEKKL